jgi:hypothetical protein
MKPSEAVMKLAVLGYCFEVAGEQLRWRFEGQGQPSPDEVRPLLQLIKESRDEVLFFLRCYCPRCGGMMFIPDLEGQDQCASCDWRLLIEIYPGLNHSSVPYEPAKMLRDSRQAAPDVARSKGMNPGPKTL